MAFDDRFETVPYLASTDKSPKLNDIVQASERVCKEDYDLAKLWLETNVVNNHLLNQEGDNISSNPVPGLEGAQTKEIMCHRQV